MRTLLEMIDHALNQAQLDTSFRTDARSWYNILAESLAIRFDYPTYRKEADGTFVAGQRTYNLPSDFFRADECYLKDSSGNQSNPAPILGAYQFRAQLIGGSSSSPSFAYINEGTRKIEFNAVPSGNNGGGYRLYYFRAPVAVATDGSDDGSIPDFPDQKTMMEELKAMAFEFRDDQRYNGKKAEAMKESAQYQRNQYNDDSYSVGPLNHVNFRSTNRRSRSRGFRNG